MKRLILMRHSYASANNPAWSDQERPLTEHGRRIAEQTGQVLQQHSIDQILHSSARRTTETAELIAAQQPEAPPLISLDELYLAAPDAYRQHLASAATEVQTLAVIGHNPGIGSLIHSMASHGPVISPATVAIFQFEVHDWSHVVANAGSPAEIQFIAEGRPMG